MESKLSQIPFKLNNGKSTMLSDYQDKTVLIVNVASECGLTPQYAALERIYEKYKDKGLVVIGFPANEFAGQEPGSNEEIKEFCQLNYGVKFPLAEKIVVKGQGQHPLYELLTEEKPVAVANPDGKLEKNLKAHGLLNGKAGEIMWNFEKFLVDKEGHVVERFAPDIEPDDKVIINAIEKTLN